MKILLITRTLSVQDGQGRYSLSLIKELSKKYQLIVLADEADDQKDSLAGPQVTVHKIPDLYLFNNPIAPIRYFLKSLRLALKVDLVHILTDFPYYILFFPLVWLRIKPFLITSHGTYGVRYLERGWRKIFLRKAYQRAKKVICVSQFTEQEILKRVRLTNTVVINNGVDYHQWQIDERPPQLAQKSILSVGAFKARKGYHISIPAVAKIKKKYPALKYYIVGDQSDKNYLQYLKDLVKKYSLKKNVIFLEKLTDNQLVKLYHQVDLFLLTPVNLKHSFEGFGLVYLEAGASGKPVIGTYNCGAEEAVKNGYNGLLVKQNDIQATVRAILKIFDNPELAKNLGENGRQLAKQMDWQNIVNQYMEIYKIP